jgi:hypothetical protein
MFLDIFKKKSNLENEIAELDAIRDRLLKQNEKTINEYYNKKREK